MIWRVSQSEALGDSVCGAMLYRYHVTRDKDEPFQTVDTMQTVEADGPLAAVAKLASAGLCCPATARSKFAS